VREHPATASTASRGRVARTRVIAVRDGRARERADGLAAEEPLEIRAAGPGQEPVRVAVTMRTPGHDFELAAGFLATEGLVAPADLATVAYCEDPDAQRYNVVTVGSRAPFDLGAAERHFFASSSCGICGKAALEAIAVRCEPVDDGATADAATLLGLPGAMRAGQRIFERTGGLHAAGLFDTGGRLLVLREDVGRHNAVDKVVGALALDGADGAGRVLLVSGRLSFEIVQKAAVARVPIVCAVSAPSSLAVEAADALGVTAVGFVRPGGFNIYAHPARVILAGAS
jgi:FdhD protein